MRGGKSYHLNSTCDIGEPDLPGPDRGKRGAVRREPLTGNTGENFESHKPVHETTTGSLNWQEWKRGRTSYLESFSAGKSRMVSSAPPRARLSHEEPEAGNLHIRVCEG